jgi:hypothetical protein
LDTCERRPIEILLQRGGYRVGLLGWQETQMELLLVVDEIAGLGLYGIRAVERQGDAWKQAGKYEYRNTVQSSSPVSSCRFIF